jgi:ATP-dependent DNA ligase
MSLSRKTKPTEEDLQKSATMLKLYVYDIYDTAQPQLTFTERNAIITYKLTWSIKDSIEISDTTAVSTTEELLAMEETYLTDDYEGIMVRVPDSVYKVDGRSEHLLKKKIFTDEEFEIIDILEGDAVWKGCAKIVIIKLPDGKTQGAGLKGDFETNRTRLLTKEQYIGKLATVCYFGKTNDGLLRFPVVKDMARPDFVNK